MAKQKALILGQDSTITEVEYDEKDSYPTMRNAVGGMIESVSYWTKNIDAYVNEEGLYTPGLNVNPFGANLRQHWMGNIVIPRITPTKVARLQDLGLFTEHDYASATR